uniref:Uncharacterized protein n=1 Tax=viral metagenome TaxID=1070528 RepID=A0A6M3KV90_9ZZZZ
MTRDEAYQEYEESLSRISNQASVAMEVARATLHDRLSVIRNALHEELKAIRALDQKTKRSK